MCKKTPVNTAGTWLPDATNGVLYTLATAAV